MGEVLGRRQVEMGLGRRFGDRATHFHATPIVECSTDAIAVYIGSHSSLGMDQAEMPVLHGSLKSKARNEQKGMARQEVASNTSAHPLLVRKQA